jgi:hypothetical protein
MINSFAWFINDNIIYKSSILTKELIESLLGIKKPDNNIDQNVPNFLKNISDFIDSSPKSNVLKRNNYFNKKDCMG